MHGAAAEYQEPRQELDDVGTVLGPQEIAADGNKDREGDVRPIVPPAVGRFAHLPCSVISLRPLRDWIKAARLPADWATRCAPSAVTAILLKGRAFCAPPPHRLKGPNRALRSGRP